MAAATQKSVIRAWEEFWFTPIQAHVYAVLRIAFGLLGLVSLLSIADFPTFWDLGGLVSPTPWVEFKAWLAINGWGNVAGRTIWFASLIAYLGMTVGYRSGLAVALAFVATLAQASWNFFPFSGAHSVAIAMLFCLLWADCGAVWSVDALLGARGGPATPPSYPIAPLRLMRFQIAVIYVNTGLWKLFSDHWRDGSALHYVLNENLFQRIAIEALPTTLNWMMTVGTYVTLGWELTFPVMILFRRTRIVALVIGVALHLGMLFSIDVGIFSFAMLASLLAFLDPDALARFHPIQRAGPSFAPDSFSDSQVENKVSSTED